MTDRDVLFTALVEAQGMVSDAIAVAEKALNRDPDRDLRRQLNEEILELKAKHAKLQGQLIALARGSSSVARPSAAQIRSLEMLSARVDVLVNRSVAASRALGIATDVLDMVQDLDLVGSRPAPS